MNHKEFKDNIKKFFKNVKNEAIETKDAAKIIEKHLKGEDVTEEEEKLLKEQIYDILKIAGIGIPFALIPGASILLPIIIKFANKYNINILPSSFAEKEKIKEDETDKQKCVDNIGHTL